VLIWYAGHAFTSILIIIIMIVDPGKQIHTYIIKIIYCLMYLGGGAWKFYPLVFSTSGGMGKAAATTYKHLACLLSEKWSSGDGLAPLYFGVLLAVFFNNVHQGIMFKIQASLHVRLQLLILLLLRGICLHAHWTWGIL